MAGLWTGAQRRRALRAIVGARAGSALSVACLSVACAFDHPDGGAQCRARAWSVTLGVDARISTETAGDDRSTRRHAHPTVIEPTRIAWSRLRPRMGQQLPSRSSYLVPQEKFVVTPSTANPAQREQPGYRTRDGGSAACKDLRSRGFMTSEGRSADGPRARPRMWRTGRGAPHDKRRTSVAKPASTCNYNKSGMVLDQGVSGDQRAKQGVPACSILHA